MFVQCAPFIGPSKHIPGAESLAVATMKSNPKRELVGNTLHVWTKPHTKPNGPNSFSSGAEALIVTTRHGIKQYNVNLKEKSDASNVWAHKVSNTSHPIMYLTR